MLGVKRQRGVGQERDQQVNDGGGRKEGINTEK